MNSADRPPGTLRRAQGAVALVIAFGEQLGELRRAFQHWRHRNFQVVAGGLLFTTLALLLISIRRSAQV